MVASNTDPRSMSEASALISGVTPLFTIEKISMGNVEAPGPVTKKEMTNSSSDMA